MTGRRQVLRAVAVTLAGSLGARAQAPPRVRRIGYLSLRAGPAAVDEAFVKGMRDLGHVPGQNLAIEYRWASNDTARLRDQAEELVRSRVEVLVTASTAAIRAVKSVTGTVPIVMAATSDPVRTGLVADLAHPGGNVTGLGVLTNELSVKRLQLLREILPKASRIGLVAWLPPGVDTTVPSSQQATAILIEALAETGRRVGIESIAQIVRVEGDLADAFAALDRARVEAVIVQLSPFAFEHRAAIVALASRRRMPDMYEIRAFADAGGLLSYGPDIEDSYRRAATYVDRILRGARPGDLPIEQPAKFEMVLNERTARSRGLAFPPDLLVRADEVLR